MKRTIGAALASFLFLPMAANAVLIDPATAVSCGAPICLQLSGDQTSQAQINVAIAGALGTSTELYKNDVGAADVGTFAASYQTTFSNTPTDPADALIEYVGGPVLNNATHLLVKDGNQTPAWYLFWIAGAWNGLESISLMNFWPSNGAISHVTIYGGGSTSVPEPAVLSLFGIALIAFGLVRRRRAAPMPMPV
jgi:hypothetical protein